MKKQLLFICILISVVSHAQKDIIVSISSGATFSNIRGNIFAEENKYDFNYVGGISIEKPISDKFSFLTGLLYDNKSFKRKIEFSSFDPFIYNIDIVKIKSTLQYLTIPILFRYYIDKENSFYINSGPYVGFFLNETTRVDGDKIKDDSNSVKTVDFGWSLGIGKKFKLTDKNNLSIELRDNLGLSNISDVPVQGNGTVKTNSFNLLVGYEFKL